MSKFSPNTLHLENSEEAAIVVTTAHHYCAASSEHEECGAPDRRPSSQVSASQVNSANHWNVSRNVSYRVHRIVYRIVSWAQRIVSALLSTICAHLLLWWMYVILYTCAPIFQARAESHWKRIWSHSEVSANHFTCCGGCKASQSSAWLSNYIDCIVWGSGIGGWNQWQPYLQMSCSDLIQGHGIRVVVSVMATRMTSSISHPYRNSLAPGRFE